jgi:hypothetical protein
MNWGNKLVVVFILFAILMATLVYKAVNTKFELVSKDYYKDELRYQDRIDGRNNAALIGKVAVTQDAEALTIGLPEEMKGVKVEGEAWFYCKTDAERDRKIALAVDTSGKQLILKKQLAKGTTYELKLNWQAGDQKYYTEQIVNVN